MTVYNLTNYDNANSAIIRSSVGGTARDSIATMDIAVGNFSICYNDTGPMALLFTNNSDVDVWIKNLQIVRVYGIKYLDTQQDCSDDETQSDYYDFTERVDYACNYEKCGGASYTGFNYDNHVGTTLYRNNSYSWYWTNPPATFNYYNNYAGPLHCFFNFNNVGLVDANGVWNNDNLEASTSDVPFYIKINDSDWVTYYHCKKNRSIGHSVDLATHTYLKNYYHDGPDGSNTLTLYLPSNPDPQVNLYLRDGGDGRINLYRVYATTSVCNSPCQGCQYCQACVNGQGCAICYGYCQTCVTACQLCESGYEWNCQTCESCFLPCYTCQPCEGCQTCYTSCQEPCQICEFCFPCEGCQSGCLTCEPGCYDCQACYNCEPNCYDFQICYACQGSCYDCEACYDVNYS